MGLGTRGSTYHKEASESASTGLSGDRRPWGGGTCLPAGEWGRPYVSLVPLESITTRAQVLQSIRKGYALEAIEKLSKMSPEILQSQPSLLSSLRMQHLIELIRQRETERGLAFARDHLAIDALEDEKLLGSLEEAMTLLAFRDVCEAPKSASNMLSSKYKEGVASRVNEAILKTQNLSTESRLQGLMKRLAWEKSSFNSHVQDYR